MKVTRVLLPTVVSLVLLVSTRQPAGAITEKIYSLPFAGQYSISCGFQWYSQCRLPRSDFHYGTDYELGIPGQLPNDGHPVQAAKRGLAKSCSFGTYTGYSILVDHGNGHRTRYLHLNAMGLPASNGQPVARGQIIGYEGMTGTDNNHLHFEVRHAATSFSCLSAQNGTAVDPYATSTFAWTTNPPSTARASGTNVLGENG